MDLSKASLKCRNVNYYLKSINCLFLYLSVSVAELLSHSEFDSDSDGSFTEAEAQVMFVLFYLDFYCVASC